MATMQFSNMRVPQEMSRRAEVIAARGGRAVGAVVDDDGHRLPGTCPNCNGGGAVALRTVVGGPYEALPSVAPAGRGAVQCTVAIIDNQLYHVHTLSWACPSCGGTGRVR